MTPEWRSAHVHSMASFSDRCRLWGPRPNCGRQLCEPYRSNPSARPWPGFRPFTRQPQSSELRDLEKSRGQLQPLSSVAAVTEIAGRPIEKMPRERTNSEDCQKIQICSATMRQMRRRARQNCRAKDDTDVRSRWPPSYPLHVIRLLRCLSVRSRGIQIRDWIGSRLKIT